MSKVLCGIYILVCVLGGVYCGAAALAKASADGDILRATTGDAKSREESIQHAGVEFLNQEHLNAFLNLEEVRRMFPWVYNIPEIIAWILGSLSFGAVGGSLTILRDRVSGSQGLLLSKWLLMPLLGALTGLALLGLSYVLPSALTISERIDVRPLSILFLSLLGGMFPLTVLQWLDSQVSKFFSGKGGTNDKS